MSIYCRTTNIDYCFSYLKLLKKFESCLNNTPITTFCYIRCYNDGRLLYLSNNETWLNAYINNKFYNNIDHVNCYTANDQGGYYTWVESKSDDVLLKAEELNIFNGINLCRKGPDFCEVFAFCSSIKHNDIINFYMNNTFRIKDIADIFCKDYLSAVKFNNSDLVMVNDDVTQKISAYCKTINKSRIKINEEITIGYKALACLYWMCQGKTADETAIILGVSRRTIEAHLDSMRIKTNCINKSQLIYKVLSIRPDILSEYHPDSELL